MTQSNAGHNGWWWLSFVDPSKAPGQRFLGVCVVEADGFENALGLAWEKKINPGGEVLGTPIPRPPAEEYRYRLMCKEEAEKADDSAGEAA